MVLLVNIFDQVACHPIFVGGPIHYVMSTRVLSPLLHSPLPCAGARPQQAAQGGRERHPPFAQRPAGPRHDGPVDRRGLETGVDRQAGRGGLLLPSPRACLLSDLSAPLRSRTRVPPCDHSRGAAQ